MKQKRNHEPHLRVELRGFHKNKWHVLDSTGGDDAIEFLRWQLRANGFALWRKYTKFTIRTVAEADSSSA